jgi:hypothetical protein
MTHHNQTKELITWFLTSSLMLTIVASGWPLAASVTAYRIAKAAGGTSTTSVIWSIGALAFPPEPSYLPELSAASSLNARRHRLPPSPHIAAASPWTCSRPHHRTSRCPLLLLRPRPSPTLFPAVSCSAHL